MKKRINPFFLRNLKTHQFMIKHIKSKTDVELTNCKEKVINILYNQSLESINNNEFFTVNNVIAFYLNKIHARL